MGYVMDAITMEYQRHYRSLEPGILDFLLYPPNCAEAVIICLPLRFHQQSCAIPLIIPVRIRLNLLSPEDTNT
jgi:hypothetical protein